MSMLVHDFFAFLCQFQNLHLNYRFSKSEVSLGFTKDCLGLRKRQTKYEIIK